MVVALIIVLTLAALAAAVILVIMLVPARVEESYVSVGGEPLALEAPSCERPREVAYVGEWDAVDQHWGETQWMMAVG